MTLSNQKELRTTHLFDFPVEMVWNAWSNPDSIAQWWGPAGFSTTIHVMDFRKNGEWKLTIHGPDGTNYPNRSLFLEVESRQKIVYEHFNPHFISNVLFESKGHQTQLTWTMKFDSPEMFEVIVKAHKADKGQQENIEKLEKFLANGI